MLGQPVCARPGRILSLNHLEHLETDLSVRTCIPSTTVRLLCLQQASPLNWRFSCRHDRQLPLEFDRPFDNRVGTLTGAQ